jgi:hypothetical protein
MVVFWPSLFVLVWTTKEVETTGV